MVETEKRLRIIELRSQGYSISRTAEEVGVAKQTVVDICREAREQVAALKAIQLDALYEECKVSTEARISSLSSIMAKIKEELDSRSLIDVPTEKLVELYLKTASTLEGTIIEPRFLSSEEQREAKEARELLDAL